MNPDLFTNYIVSVLPMTPEQAGQIAQHFSPLVIYKQDCLVNEGAINNRSFFLEEGYCRAFTHDVDNNDVTTDLFIGRCFANDFVSFFRRTPSQETIQALTDCRGWAITYEAVQTCFHTIPAFREFGRMLLINNAARLKQRMLAMIQQTAEQRYARLMATSPDVFQHVPLKHIATYLGVTDTSLSRIRKGYAGR